MSRLTFLTIVITLTFTGTMLASGLRSQDLKDVKISITAKGEVLKNVLTQLEKETGFSFGYSEEIGNTSGIRLPAKTSTLYDILKEIARQKNLRFVQESYLIAVVKVPPPLNPGKIYGKVVDDKGQPLPGANIRIPGLNTGTTSSVDGTYSISAAPGNYTVEVSYISCQTKRISDVLVKPDGLTKLDVVLLYASNALGTVVVRSSYTKESAAGLYTQQKNAASVTDGISSEQMARTPDNNMGQVMKRISGVSTVNNRYVIVRGLTERYNQGMIDGIVLPSTDMNRHNFAFDVIPVEMVSNVVVNKTATPDVSAEFAGGQVSVNTLDIPKANFTVLSVGTGFNSNTLGKDFLQDGKRGKYDFLGFDDGSRKLPNGIRSWTNGAPPDYAVSQSKEFSADAFKEYRSPGGLNQNYRFSAGRVYKLKNDQQWGFVAGVSLRNNQETADYQNARPFAADSRYIITTSLPIAYIDSAKIRREGHIYKYNTIAGAQFNIGVQGKKYKIGLRNIFSQIMNNTLNTYTGANKEDYFTASPGREQSSIQDPEFTHILQNKLDGEHALTKGGLKLTWLLARTEVSQETRDRTKFMNKVTLEKDGVEYYQTPIIANPATNNPVYNYRIYTNTKETDYNWALNLSQPFDFLGDKSMVKAGYNGIDKKRGLSATTLNIRTEDRAFDAFDHPFQEIMAPENMGIGAGQAYYWADGSSGSQFKGKASLNAGYLMLDQRFLKKIRLVYGMRVEKYMLKNAQSLSLSGGSSVDITGETNTNYLPSVNFTYGFTPSMNFRASYAKTVIRPDFRETSYFGFYDTELDAMIAGANVVSTKISNTDVRYEWFPAAGEIISVSGFYKSFDKPIELIIGQEASGFVSEYHYQNQKSAQNYGVEMEIRKTLGFIAAKQWLRNISLFGNGTLIKSKVNTRTVLGDGTIVENKETRALYGQSPYIINAGISYTSPDYGLTLSYNRAGRRTYTISQNPASTEYENGRNQVDLQLFCRLLKEKMELKLNVGNLLNSPAIYYTNNNGYLANGLPQSDPNFSYDKKFGTDAYEKKYDDVRYRIKYGVNTSMTITYKF